MAYVTSEERARWRKQWRARNLTARRKADRERAQRRYWSDPERFRAEGRAKAQKAAERRKRELLRRILGTT